MKIAKQPIPRIGTTFTGWAAFNWGVCHQQVFRTRQEAKNWCIRTSTKKDATWNDVKDHFRVVKVECVVIKN